MSWTAEDIMTRRVLCVYANMELRELAKLFLDTRITGAPVTDTNGKLLGVVSQTDLLRYDMNHDTELMVEPSFYATARIEGRHLPRGFQVQDTNTGTVADVMSPVAHTVTPTASVESVARLMRRKHVHRVIVTKTGKVVGIISALDLLAALFSPKKKKKSRKK
jgi:CBS domain-containing protein